jgi:hypothetical protein
MRGLRDRVCDRRNFLLAYLALVFDAAERGAIYRFLSHMLAVRADSPEAASLQSS